jgi:hypothetical protein
MLLVPILQLTVAEALVEATLDESYQDILKATQLLVFFGTPHQGGNLATVGDYVAKLYLAMSRNPRNDLVEALKATSDSATKRFEQFRHKHEDFLVISCFEGRPYSKATGLVSIDVATFPFVTYTETSRLLTNAQQRSIFRVKEKSKFPSTRTIVQCASFHQRTTRTAR